MMDFNDLSRYTKWIFPVLLLIITSVIFLRQAKVGPEIEINGKTVSLRNAFIDMELSLVSGPEITKFVNRYLPDQQRNCVRKPSSLFSLYRAGQKIPNENYQASEVSIEQSGKCKSLIVKMNSGNVGPLELKISIGNEPEVRWNFRLLDSPGVKNLKVSFPELKHLALSENIDKDYYLLPSHALLIDNKYGDDSYNFGTLSGSDNGLLTEWLDVFNQDAGMYFRVNGEHDIFKTFHLGKRNSGDPEAGIRIAVSYIERDLPKGAGFRPMEAVIGVHQGDWRIAFEQQRDYLQKEFPPHRPQASWADRVWSAVALHPKQFLGKDGYKLKEVAEMAEYAGFGEMWGWWFELKDSADMGIGGVTQAHSQEKVIDFIKTEYGQYNTLKGGIKTLKQYIDEWHKYGRRIDMYMNIQMSGWNNANKGYTYKNQPWESWCVRLQPGGEPYKNFNSYIMCLSAKEWQDFLARSCARILKDTDCGIIRLDTMGTHSLTCRNPDHGHDTYNNWTSADMWFDAQIQLVNKVRDSMDKVKTDYMLIAESPGTPRLIREISGSLSYAVSRGGARGDKAPVDTCRFLFPHMQLWAYPHRHLSSTNDLFLIQAMFNGAGVIFDFPKSDPVVIARWKRVNDFLDENRDVFTTKNPVPLVPTLQEGIYANYFPGKAKNMYMLLNMGNAAYQGGLLRVKSHSSTHWVDVYNHNPLQVDGDNIVKTDSFPANSLIAMAELPQLITARLTGDILEINCATNIANSQWRLLKVTSKGVSSSELKPAEFPNVKIKNYFDTIENSAHLAVQLLKDNLLVDEWVTTR